MMLNPPELVVLRERLAKLDKYVRDLSQDGAWNYSYFMYGKMAGALEAQAIMDGREGWAVDYPAKPEVWKNGEAVDQMEMEMSHLRHALHEYEDILHEVDYRLVNATPSDAISMYAVGVLIRLLHIWIGRQAR